MIAPSRSRSAFSVRFRRSVKVVVSTMSLFFLPDVYVVTHPNSAMSSAFRARDCSTKQAPLGSGPVKPFRSVREINVAVRLLVQRVQLSLQVRRRGLDIRCHIARAFALKFAVEMSYPLRQSPQDRHCPTRRPESPHGRADQAPTHAPALHPASPRPRTAQRRFVGEDVVMAEFSGRCPRQIFLHLGGIDGGGEPGFL